MQKGWNYLLMMIVVILVFVTGLQAQSQAKVTVNLLDETKEGGSWAGLVESKDGDNASLLTFEVKPALGNAGVAVTLVFHEPESGYMKVFWTGAQTSETLSDNFYDGIGMANQKTIVIPSRLTQVSGTLEILYTGKPGSVRAASFEVLDLDTVAVARSTEPVAYVARSGRAILHKDVNGDAVALLNDQWQDNTVTAPLIDLPEKLNETVAVAFTAGGIPLMSRLSAKFAGVDAFSLIHVWINGKNAGHLNLNFPELSDMGYRLNKDGKIVFDGWVEASLLVPAEFLSPGENTIQLITDNASKKDFAVKEMLIQMNYPQEPALTEKSFAENEESVQIGQEENHSGQTVLINEENHENEALPIP